MSKIVALCFVTLVSSSCNTMAYEQPARVVSLSELTSNPEKFVGQHIRTGGCAQYHAHGAHISPCKKHDWREILIIDDAPNFSAAEQIAKSGLNIWKSPYAEFSGVIRKSRSEINAAKSVYTFVVDQVNNAQAHEP